MEKQANIPLGGNNNRRVNEVDHAREEHAAGVRQQIVEWANTDIYPTPKPLGVSLVALAQTALRHYSDLELQMPWDLYYGIATATEHFTVQQIDVALQVVGMASAEKLTLPIEDYIKLKLELRSIGTAFSEYLEAGKQKIKDENPYIEIPEGTTVAPAGEA